MKTIIFAIIVTCLFAAGCSKQVLLPEEYTIKLVHSNEKEEQIYVYKIEQDYVDTTKLLLSYPQRLRCTQESKYFSEPWTNINEINTTDKDFIFELLKDINHNLSAEDLKIENLLNQILNTKNNVLFCSYYSGRMLGIGDDMDKDYKIIYFLVDGYILKIDYTNIF